MCQGHYSPKISEELIPELYQKAQIYGVRMTTLADILIREGLKNADITLALEARPEAKKVKTAFMCHYHRAVAKFFKG